MGLHLPSLDMGDAKAACAQMAFHLLVCHKTINTCSTAMQQRPGRHPPPQLRLLKVPIPVIPVAHPMLAACPEHAGTGNIAQAQPTPRIIHCGARVALKMPEAAYTVLSNFAYNCIRCLLPVYRSTCCCLFCRTSPWSFFEKCHLSSADLAKISVDAPLLQKEDARETM